MEEEVTEDSLLSQRTGKGICTVMQIFQSDWDEGYTDSANQPTDRKALKINQATASNKKVEVQA